MLLQSLREHKDVVHVHDHRTTRDEVYEQVVHHGLERGGAVGETEEHDKRLEQPTVGAERRLPLIALTNPDVVVAPANVELCEVLGATELVDELGDEGEGVVVLPRDGVELAVVLDETETAILLLDKEHRRPER